MKRMIDADELIRAMKERDEDCGEPKNAVDRGYSLAVEHMNEEIKRISNQKCENCEYFGRPEDAPETVEKDCMWECYREEDESYIPPCKRKTILGTTIEDLREELSRGCEYSATQEVVHQSFYEAMEELGGTGDWDEMAAEDLEGQMCVLQSLFETFYDKTVEKILNYIGSYEEEEQ